MRRVTVPGDKSMTHRALLVGSLATGRSQITGALDAADTRSTAQVLRALGVEIATGATGEVTVAGRGLRGLLPPGAALDCGNSGTTARLLLGMLAAQPLTAIVTGDTSLTGRPMRRVTSPLLAMGARIRELGAVDRLPVEVAGGFLAGIEYESPTASAQVKSAILLAGLAAGVPVTVTEPLPSRDHTERLLRSLGVDIVATATAAGNRISMQPASGLPPLELRVPGDFSAAAFVIAAALLLGTPALIEGVGVNPTRTGLLSVLERMGARLDQLNPRAWSGEPVADLLARPGPLRATRVDGVEIPRLIDEVPALAALAVHAEGETLITGAAELRVKESDRIAMLVANLRAVGVAAEELPDGMVIPGTTGRLRGTVVTAGDHRIAMAFGLLAAVPGNQIRIDDPGAVGVSYPAFWQMLASLGAPA